MTSEFTEVIFCILKDLTGGVYLVYTVYIQDIQTMKAFGGENEYNY